jgi:exopolysaccharide biosynthesis polyprenyl glycosylphosphotransferase
MAISVWASAVVLLPVGQAAVRQFMRSRGIGCKHLVVVGDMDRAMPLIEELSKSGSTYRVAGVVSVASMPGRLINMSDIQEEQPVSTRDLNELPEVMDESQATEVLIAVSNEKYSEVRETVRKTVSADVNVHVAIDPLLQEATSGEPEMVEGIPAVRFKGKKMPWQYETIKRAFDFTAALTLLILASPLLAVVAFAVKLDSPGPIFFKQVRVGRRGQKFGMYKFRSMKPNAEALLADLMEQNEASGQMFKMRNDPRITRVGKILRKLSIDELPQLFNVLNGTMSLVGPRPPLPKEVADYEDWHYERLDGVPGITGLWQVKRGPVLDFLEMVNYDLEYLRNWSLAKDIYILLKTVPVVITGRGAY